MLYGILGVDERRDRSGRVVIRLQAVWWGFWITSAIFFLVLLQDYSRTVDDLLVNSGATVCFSAIIYRLFVGT